MGKLRKLKKNQQITKKSLKQVVVVVNWRITMTSLFSNSLLNDTERDVRGAYTTFSRTSERAVSPQTDSNDRLVFKRGQSRQNFGKKIKYSLRENH